MKSSEAMIFAVMSAIFATEATDVGSWSFVGSNGPVRNESMMKWYI